MGTNKTLKRRLQRKRKKMNTADVQNKANAFWSMNSLAFNTPVVCSTAPVQKKGKPMYDYDEQPTVENRKLTHAQNRVSNLYYQKDMELRKMFHLDEDERPHTGEELLTRIKDGKYSLKNEDDIKNIIKWSVLDYFTWRDPAHKPDKAGYTQASKELNEAQSIAHDLVTLGTSKEALEAITELATWQPSNAPKTKK